MASAFSTRRDSNSKFTDLTFATVVARQYYKKPKFSGPPNTLYYVRGNKVPTIEKSGSVYSISAALTYSPNMVRVLVDYLVNDPFGPRLVAADLNLKALYGAQQTAGEVVQGENNMLDNVAVPDNVNMDAETDAGAVMTTPHCSLGDLTSTSSVPALSRIPAAPKARTGYNQLLRYEFNGRTTTRQSYQDNIDDILSCAPGAEFFRDLNGEYKLVLPDSMTTEANQSVVTIGADNISKNSKISYKQPDNNEKINTIKVNFPNVNKNYANDSVTFPVKDGLLHQLFLSEDGGVPLYQDYSVFDVNNPYHARTIASTNLLISRRGRTNNSIDLRTGFVLEPGDVLTYVDPIFSTTRFYKIQETELNRAAVNLTMLDFDKDDAAWFVDEQDTFDNIDVLVTSVPAPTALTGTFSEDTRLVTLVITPSTDEDYEVIAYDIGVTHDGGTTWSLLTSIAADLDDDDANDLTQTYETPVGIDSGTVAYRVKAKSLRFEVSDWLVSNDITITEIADIDR